MSKLASDLRTLSREAYTYLYPLVIMDVTRLQGLNTPAGTRPGFGPANAFHHLREFPAADFRAVVRPNFDTLYSIAWLDLTAGPVVLHTPDTDDRYSMLPLLDMWTDVFATLGKRTTGTGPQDFVVVSPGSPGTPPEGLPVIEAPTPYVWVIGRTQTNGPADYEAVHAVQDGLRITTLAPSPEHPVDPDHDTTTEALTVVDRMDAAEFFTRAARALAVNPPHPTDFAVLARIAALGIVPGRAFDPGRFDAGLRTEVEAGAREAREAIRTGLSGLGSRTNGWTVLTESMGVYGNAYLRRAAVAAGGLGANPAEDAVYPLLHTDAHGEPLSGEYDYLVHFPANALPPVSAFWSITMYDGEGFQVANELNRYALGDRDPLEHNPDGSLDIHVRQRRPDPALLPNWLPAPAGPLGITLRLYAPTAEVLDGRWSPPVVRRV